MQIGHRMRELREAMDMTQIGAAKALGISRTTYTGYETGHRHPDIVTLVRIADLFVTSTDYLTGQTDSPVRPPLPCFDAHAKDWYDKAPGWLRELFDDPDCRPYIQQADVREALLALTSGGSWQARSQSNRSITVDVLMFIAWRLDQKDANQED